MWYLFFGLHFSYEKILLSADKFLYIYTLLIHEIYGGFLRTDWWNFEIFSFHITNGLTLQFSPQPTDKFHDIFLRPVDEFCDFSLQLIDKFSDFSHDLMAKLKQLSPTQPKNEFQEIFLRQTEEFSDFFLQPVGYY